jgi:RNA polymerase sigma factor (TIGR02999 family)
MINQLYKGKDMTLLLNAWQAGDEEASSSLMSIIYDELCVIARSQLKSERGQHTYMTQGLVNEAYLRFCCNQGLSFQSRAHFFGIASRTMRQILVDHARGNAAEKRGGQMERVYVENIDGLYQEEPVDLIKLDRALKELSEFDKPKANMVEVRYFGGLTIEETAQVLGLSPATLKRDWKIAKAWLLRRMKN